MWHIRQNNLAGLRRLLSTVDIIHRGLVVVAVVQRYPQVGPLFIYIVCFVCLIKLELDRRPYYMSTESNIYHDTNTINTTNHQNTNSSGSNRYSPQQDIPHTSPNPYSSSYRPNQITYFYPQNYSQPSSSSSPPPHPLTAQHVPPPPPPHY